MTSPLTPVPGSAEVLAEHEEGSQRYRLARTDRGFLVTSRTRGETGMVLAAEWLHRTEEAAWALLEAVIAGDQATRALGTVAGQRALERFLAVGWDPVSACGTLERG